MSALFSIDSYLVLSLISTGLNRSRVPLSHLFDRWSTLKHSVSDYISPSLSVISVCLLCLLLLCLLCLPLCLSSLSLSLSSPSLSPSQVSSFDSRKSFKNSLTANGKFHVVNAARFVLRDYVPECMEREWYLLCLTTTYGNTLCQHSISVDDLREQQYVAEEFQDEALRVFGPNSGLVNKKFNLHARMHDGQCIVRHSSMPNYWCYTDERINFLSKAVAKRNSNRQQVPLLLVQHAWLCILLDMCLDPFAHVPVQFCVGELVSVERVDAEMAAFLSTLLRRQPVPDSLIGQYVTRVHHAVVHYVRVESGCCVMARDSFGSNKLHFISDIFTACKQSLLFARTRVCSYSHSDNRTHFDVYEDTNTRCYLCLSQPFSIVETGDMGDGKVACTYVRM